MAWSVYVVDSRVKLRDLCEHAKPRLVRRYRAVEFALPELSREENEKLTSELNQRYRACGCGEGAVVGMVALVAYITTQVTGADVAFHWIQIPMAIGVLFVGTTVGKLLGVYRAYFSFRRRLKEVIDQVGAPAEKPEEPRCAVN